MAMWRGCGGSSSVLSHVIRSCVNEKAVCDLKKSVPLGFQSRCYSESRRDGVHKMFFGPLVFHNKRHRRSDKKLLARQPHKAPDIKVHDYGVRSEGVKQPRGFQLIKAMQPQLVVPQDLDSCPLKPYVSYRCRDIEQEELTPKDLFNAVYGSKIVKDFKENKIDENGSSLEPSHEENLEPQEARRRARKTGSDIFLGGTQRTNMWKVRWQY